MTPEQQFERFRRDADSESLAAVFDALAPELLLVAAHLAPSGTEAEDLVQATFLDAIEKASQWDAGRRVAPWLIGILLNHARSERRQHRRDVEADRLPPRSELEPDASAATEESLRLIHEAVAAMPRTYRQVLNLRLLHGLTPTQIAQVLECPIATAKTRLQRGIAMLRKSLPTSLAASLAILFVGERGLAQVRQAVLNQAEAAAATAATVAVGVGTTAVGAGILMNKLSITVIAALGLVGLWNLIGPPVELQPPEPGHDVTAGASTTATQPAADQNATTAPPVNLTGTPERAPATTTGSVELEFVWRHDASPARNLLVWLEPDGRPDLSRSLSTNESGTLRLEELQPQAYRVNGPSLSHLLVVRAGQASSERIEVQAQFLLSGAVVDLEGHGVGGAEVFAQDLMSALDTDPRRLAVTAPDGSFEAAADRIGYLWASCDGYIASSCNRHGQDDREPMRLVLGGPAASVRGVVRTADGRLAANAHLMVVNHSNPNLCQAPVHLQTNASGAFASNRLGGGKHLLVAEAEGHAATVVTFEVGSIGTATLDVRLERGGALTGCVFDGRDVPVRATVQVHPGWAGSPTGWVEALRPLYLCYRPTCESGSDGRYRLENVPTGAVSLSIKPHSRHKGLDASLRVADEVTHERDFLLEDPANDEAPAARSELLGRVINSDGAPLAGWHVRVRSSRGATRTVLSDDDGAFRVMVRDASTVALAAMPPGPPAGFAWATQSDVLPSAGPVELRVLHQPSSGSWLLGRALAVDGRVASATQLQLWRIESDEIHKPTLGVGPDGSFEWGPCPPGRYSVSLVLSAGGAMHLSTVNLAPKQRFDLGAVQPRALGRIEVRAQAERGTLFEPDELVLWDQAGNRTSDFRRNADGSFRSIAVPPGVFTLALWGEGFARTEREVVVVSRRTSPVLVAVKPAANVRFEVRSGDRDVEDVALTIRTESGEWVLSRALVHSPGQALLTRGLPAGSYRLEATADGALTASGTFRVVGLESQTVGIVLAR